MPSSDRTPSAVEQCSIAQGKSLCGDLKKKTVSRKLLLRGWVERGVVFPAQPVQVSTSCVCWGACC